MSSAISCLTLVTRHEPSSSVVGKLLQTFVSVRTGLERGLRKKLCSHNASSCVVALKRSGGQFSVAVALPSRTLRGLGDVMI